MSKSPREPDGPAFHPQVLGFGLVIIDIETAENIRDPLLDDRAQQLDTRRAGRPLKALAETFHQDFADRLRPSWLRIFFLNPAVQRRKLIGLEPDLNLDALTGRNRASFLWRSEEHKSELQSLMRISSPVFCLKKKKNTTRST